MLAKSAAPANDVDYFAAASLPTVLAGNPVSVVGLELCYSIPQVALVEPIVDRIALQGTFGTQASPVPSSLATLAADETGRVDSACTTFRFDAEPLAPASIVGIGLRVDYPDANTFLDVGSASLIVR